MKAPEEVERLLDDERARLNQSTSATAMTVLCARIEALEWVLGRSDEDADEPEELGVRGGHMCACGHYRRVHVTDDGPCHASVPCGCGRFALRFPDLEG